MFLTNFRTPARADGAGDRSPWGSFWFEPVGGRSISGMRVNSQTAMRLSAVYSCVRVLAETMAALPLRLYRRRADGGRDLVTDHWLYTLLARRPNDWQTPFEWREMMQGHLALRGNAFNQIIANRKGEITDLVPLHPDRVTIELLDSGNFRYRVKGTDGTETILSRGEVWHLRGLSSDGIVGLNPMEVARDVLGLGLSAQDYGARFFANDAKPGGWIEMVGDFKDDTARQTFKESWKASQSGSNRGKTAVLTNGMKYHELTLNNSDAQFLESRKFSRSEIASMFRVPPHLIGDLERATFSNIEQQSLDFVMHTMTPVAERWEGSIETNLLPDDEQLEVEFDFANLLRGDRAARVAYHNGGITGGWLVPNEARISEGLNPLPGLDKPLRPLNMVEVSDTDDEPAGAAKIPASHPDMDARAVALATAAAERIVRKQDALVAQLLKTTPTAAEWADAMSKHADFVAKTLNLSPDIARAYVDGYAREAVDWDAARFHKEALNVLTTLALKGSL